MLSDTIFWMGPAAAYASILVSYHLFLGFLVFAADQKKGFSMPIVQTIAYAFGGPRSSRRVVLHAGAHVPILRVHQLASSRPGAF